MNYQDYVTAQQMQIQAPQYQTAEMMPIQQMQPRMAMPPRSAEEEEYRRQQMIMSGLDPDSRIDRISYTGQNVMSMPARIMEAPGAIGKKAKKQAKGLLDLFK
jgi:hypothetical protein